jgi:hypothetical protein
LRFTFLAVALLLTSCGYVGEPLPPALNIPIPITDLRVEQVGDQLKIAFTAPQMTTENLVMRTLGGVEVKVNEVSVPAQIEKPGLVEVAAPAKALAGQHAEVRVRVSSAKGRWSDWAGKGIDVIEPLTVPGDFKAVPAPNGVFLKWSTKAPEARLFRRLGPVFTELGVSNDGKWLDQSAKYGERYAYQVEAVSGAARSERSQPVEIAYEDIFAPSVPAGLTAVAGIGSIELAWDRSPEADVAGFRVYRSLDGNTWTQLGAGSPAASYSDRDVKTGMLYRYAVSAFDQKGNESARSKAVEMTAP